MACAPALPARRGKSHRRRGDPRRELRRQMVRQPSAGCRRFRGIHGGCLRGSEIRPRARKSRSPPAARASAMSAAACRCMAASCSPSMRMNRILGMHPEDGVAIVQPGVITGDLAGSRPRRRLGIPAGSRVAQGMLDRRQHRHQCRRPALFEIRRHPQLRARAGSRARRRPQCCAPADGCTKTRPASTSSACSPAPKAC